MATVLIVDDRPANRERLASILSESGHRFLEAEDGPAALDVARRERPNLIVADVLLPTMDGDEFVRRVRAAPELARTRIVLSTARFHEPEVISLARAGGLAGVLTTPFEPEPVRRAVAAALASESALVPAADPFSPEWAAEPTRMLRRTNDRLTAILELSLQIGAERDLDRLLHTFTHAAREIIGARYAMVGIGSHPGNGNGRVGATPLQTCVTSGLDATAALRLGTPELGQDRLTHLLKGSLRGINPGGNPVDAGFGDRFPPIHSWLGAPVRSATGTHGLVLLVDKLGAAEFRDDDERLLTILAAQVGRVYETGALYRDTVLRSEDLIRKLSDRNRIENEARQRLERILASNPAVLYSAAIEDDRVRAVAWISDNVPTVMGYAPDEARARDWWFGNVHPADLDRVRDTVHRALPSHGHAIDEYRFRYKDGAYHWVRCDMRLLRDPAGRPVEIVGSWSDITERKQLEDQILQSQKMEAIGKLAGGIAHDFNNLLTVINGYSELLIEAFQPGDGLYEPLGEIRNAGERAASLTRQLLAFSRKAVLNPVIVDVNALVKNLQKMLDRVIGEDIELKTVLKAAGQVKVDPGQMEQVIMNLVVNARYAMPRGGTLLIETATISLDDAYAKTHPEVAPGSFIQLSVSDTGTGMDAATRARIFEPFFTTKGPDQGTGLGLSVVHGIVKQSGGRIEVYSEPGIGTTFKIYLPRTLVAAPASCLLPATPARGGTETLLLVEDEAGVRALARLILERHGYAVLEARNGEEALAVSRGHVGHIHLLVTDAVMPKLSGPELAGQLVQSRAGLRVLFLSGYTDDAIIHHGIIDPNTPFLQKPFTSESLALKVREILDGA